MSAHERPWVSWNWRIAVLFFIVANTGVWAGRRRVRGPAVAGGAELSTNTLAETHHPAHLRYDTKAHHPTHLDYDAMLEDMNGDFGIRSEVAAAARQEPEYRGSETIVVPLYIPDGALPISLARIARSGGQQPVVDLLDMEMSPSADSILIRRIGPVGGRRTRPPPPGRAAWRTPHRARLSRLTPIRRSDQAGRRPVATPPAPVAPLARFGQRLSAPSLVAVRRVALPETQPSTDHDHGDDDGGGLDDTSTKRAKKNEFSKDSQFPEELHTTTTVPEHVGQAPSSTPDTVGQAPSSTPDTDGQGPSSTPDTVGQAPSSSPDTVGQAPSSTPDTDGQGPSSTPDTDGQGPSSTPDTVGQARSSTPDTVGRARSSTPDTVGRAPSSTPDTVGQGPSSTPDTVGQAPSSTPDTVGRARSSTPDTVGRARSSTPDTVGRARSSPSASSTARPTTAPERGDKRIATRKLLKRLPLVTTTTPPPTTTPDLTTPLTTTKPPTSPPSVTTQSAATTPSTVTAPTPKSPSTTSPTTTSTTATVATTTTTTTSTTTTPSATTLPSTTLRSTAAPATTETTSTTAKPTERRKALRKSSTQDNLTTSTTSVPPTTKWDRRSVHFPPPVKAILRVTTEKSTTTSASTTTIPPTTTTTTTTTSRSPSTRLRILPPWLKRSKTTTTTGRTPTTKQSTLTTTTTTSTTTRAPVLTERPTGFGRLRIAVTKRPLNTTTERPKLPAIRRLSTSTEAPSAVLTTTKKAEVTSIPTSTTTDHTTVSTTSTVDTTRRPPVVTRRPVISPERLPPVRRMPSVSEIFRDAEAPDDPEALEEPVETTFRSFSTTKSPSIDEMLKKITTGSSFTDEGSVKNSTSTPEKERERKPPILWFLGGDRDDEKQETSTKASEHKPTVTELRKFARRPRPTPSTSDPKVSIGGSGRPVGHRRRRPLRPRITIPPPITHLRDFFTPPEETISFRWTTENQKTTITMTSSTTPPTVVSTTTLPTPAATTNKSPEQVVIESLTEIMREATNNNKSKDKVSSIASNLEALNKQLAEQGIHIIHAEIDGVKIKLDNRTITRPIHQPVVTTFRPSVAPETSSVSEFSTTEKPATSIASPPTGGREGSAPDGAEDNKPTKQIFTSVKSSFSFHTSKPTDGKDEVDSDNEVQSTTDDSSFITTKPVEARKFTDKPAQEESSRPALSSSLLPSVEEAEEDPARNKTQPDGSSKTPVVDETSSTVRTSTPQKDRDKEGEQDGAVTSVAIFATSTVPASVTTRTRSTTVPITTQKPATTPFLHSPSASQSGFVGFSREDSFGHSSSETKTDGVVTEEPAFDISVMRNRSLMHHFPHIPFSIHPTAHHRPTSLPPSPDTTPAATTTKPSTSSESTGKDSATTVKATVARTTTQRPLIEVISITREIQDSPFAPGSAATVENIESDDFSNSSSPSASYTASYVVGVIGIIPAAGLAAFLARKFLKKTQKALPESEEPAEGFTPVTHHSRKPSHSNTLDADGSSVEAKNPKYTPWEFPRAKLRLVSILGEGNFGVVWKAEARELCACEGAPGGPTVLVAVKGVKEGAGLKERQDLLKELAIMQHIGQHPNVVTLLGCCTQQEPHYVIMEYVMFGKLLTFLRDHRTRQNYYNFSSDTEALTSRDLTRFACQVATGCEYLQARGIIHRDLASRNILVDHNKLCKIADFGLARNVKDLGSDIYEQKSRGALPIRWMAPESLYMNIFTHKSDVWSFGIMCWEIVTLGSTPYPGMTAREVMRRVREGYRLERPEHCHPELYRVVTKCWHQDLNKRPSFSEVKKDLAQLLEQGHTGYIDLENFPEANYFSMHENNDEKL